ncbi:hypothetical protein ACWGBX_21740, partial [Streptomyces sp. NPDC055037]
MADQKVTQIIGEFPARSPRTPRGAAPGIPKPLPSGAFTIRGANAETNCAAAPWTSATLFDAVVRHRVTV